MSLLATIRFIANHPLNREHKLESILRFARWQLESRVASGDVVYDWVNGSRFFVKSGETGLTGNIYTGLHEFADMGFLLHFLRAEDLFVDIGANVGSYTILACAAIGARGVAFEPVPGTFARLVANMRLNQLADAVRCINKGVGAKQGTVSFTSDRDTTNRALAPGERCGNEEVVDVTTLDAALHGEGPSLVKIDVEGYEFPVLEGAQETLKNQTLCAAIVELNGSSTRYGFDESKILDLMYSYGFKTYSYDPLSRTLANLEGKSLISDNTLFIRNRSLVEDRLRRAPKIVVQGKQF